MRSEEVEHGPGLRFSKPPRCVALRSASLLNSTKKRNDMKPKRPFEVIDLTQDDSEPETPDNRSSTQQPPPSSSSKRVRPSYVPDGADRMHQIAPTSSDSRVQPRSAPPPPPADGSSAEHPWSSIGGNTVTSTAPSSDEEALQRHAALLATVRTFRQSAAFGRLADSPPVPSNAPSPSPPSGPSTRPPTPSSSTLSRMPPQSRSKRPRRAFKPIATTSHSRRGGRPSLSPALSGVDGK